MSAHLSSQKQLAVSLLSMTIVSCSVGLGGCGLKSGYQETLLSGQAAAPPNPASSPVNAPTAYTPPTAAQLRQLVAPIALYPDKLVAQVLAASTYPDQLVTANQWRIHNAALKPADLAAAANVQRWDVSIKSLTAFPMTLSQLADNQPWTRALGDAYINDPADVMNAIQQLRHEAQTRGNLKSSAQLRVAVVSRPSRPYEPPPIYSDVAPIYTGIPVIATPPQVITIAPAVPDIVFVPQYDPRIVYGEPLRPYPGYVYREPTAVGYSSGTLITVGMLSFGAGILVGSAIDHDRANHWHAWDLNWGGQHHHDNSVSDQARPTVIYNNAPYATRSTTIVNRVVNTVVTNTAITNNSVNNNGNRTYNSGNKVNNVYSVNNTSNINNSHTTTNTNVTHNTSDQGHFLDRSVGNQPSSPQQPLLALPGSAVAARRDFSNGLPSIAALAPAVLAHQPAPLPAQRSAATAPNAGRNDAFMQQRHRELQERQFKPPATVQAPQQSIAWMYQTQSDRQMQPVRQARQFFPSQPAKEQATRPTQPPKTQQAPITQQVAKQIAQAREAQERLKQAALPAPVAPQHLPRINEKAGPVRERLVGALRLQHVPEHIAARAAPVAVQHPAQLPAHLSGGGQAHVLNPGRNREPEKTVEKK